MMQNLNANGKKFGDGEKDDVEPKRVSLTTPFYIGTPLPEFRKGRFVASRPSAPSEHQFGRVGLLYPDMHVYGNESGILSSDSRCFGQHVNLGQRNPVSSNIVGRLIKVEQQTVKQCVAAAATSSSSIGDINTQDVAEIQRGTTTQSAEFHYEPLTLLSLTANPTTPEDFVSSTTGNDHSSTLIEIINLARQAIEAGICGRSTPTEVHPSGNDFADSILGTSITMEENVLGEDFWNNCPVEPDSVETQEKLYEESGEVPGDEEDIGDDDSSGLILKDETDTAEEEPQSGDDVTDASASETEDQKSQEQNRKTKPIITISDQYYPRLVIDFGEEGQTEVFEARNTLSSPSSTTTFTESVINDSRTIASDGVIHDSGNGNQSGSNNINISVLDSNVIPIQKWVDFTQRYNKRKRADLESLEEYH